MMLKKVVVNNFRSFYGKNEIGFSCDSVRNVTLIHGENGTGKTALLNAILWCFFEKFTENFKKKDDLLCHDALESGETNYSVEVYFESDQGEYRVVRRGGAITDFTVNELSKGVETPYPNPKAFLNSILPADLAPYFFFAGEGLSALAQRSNRTKFHRAIRDILGFSFAEKATEDLEYVSKKWTKLLKELASGQEEVKKALEEKERLVEELDNLKSQLVRKEDEVLGIQKRITSIDSKIESSGVVEAEQVQKELNAANIQLDERINQRKIFREDRRRLIQNYGWVVLGSSIGAQMGSYIESNTKKATIPAPYDEAFVKDILERGECICGNPLEERTPEYRLVESLIQDATTGEWTNRIQKVRSVADKVRGSAKEFIREFRAYDEKFKINEKEIGFLETRIEELNKEIDGVPKDEIKVLRAERSRLRELQKSSDQEVGGIRELVGRIKEEIKKNDKMAEQKADRGEKFERLLASQQVIDAMVSHCERKLGEIERQAISHISTLVNKIMDEFSRKDYCVSIDKEFNVSLLRNDGNETGYSDGEELLLNLAFVSALIVHAKERQTQSDDFLIGGTVAPFLVDAPFGELDNTYKRSTVRFLPESAPQLILLLSSSHWAGEVDDAVKDRVGKEYVLVSYRKSAQGAKPSDKIMVNGREIEQTMYDQKFDGTRVVEV